LQPGLPVLLPAPVRVPEYHHRVPECHHRVPAYHHRRRRVRVISIISSASPLASLLEP
jgi:hypothetical protein